MHKRFAQLFINLYMVAGIIHIFMSGAGNDSIVTLTKYALMPCLMLYVYFDVGMRKETRLIFLALLFSWFGDSFLMYTAKNDMYFLAGLGSFLAAHIFYIFTFRQLIDKDAGRFQRWHVAPFVLFALLLLSYIYDSLEDYLIPVIIYATAITGMGVFAMKRNGKTSAYSFGLVMSGAVLFIASDSMIAINKFQAAFPAAGILIMATYIGAQYLIINGSVLHIKEKAPQ